MTTRLFRIAFALVALAAVRVDAQPATLSAGFAKFTITPVGPSPAGWGFVPQPVTGVWGEQFVDLNGNGCFDLGMEPFIDDIRNTQIDPQSAGKWDGISTNAGFGGRCALGKRDDTWARAVVFSSGGKNVAMVSIDVVGFFQEEIDRIRTELAAKHPAIQLDAVIVASTHVHEGPDTMGLWSGTAGYVLDGKYPLYQQYIRSRVVQAIATAYYARETAWVKFARGTETRGLRDSRGPIVYDPDVWAAEFVRPLTGTTIGTIVNWSNHPEAQGSGNAYISSDYPAGVRARMEAVRGGTSVFFSGSVGGLMTPLSVNNVPGFPSDDHSHARALKIGEIVADAALAALATAPYATSTQVSVAHKDILIPLENQSLVALNTAGLFDRQLTTDGAGQVGVLTEMYAVRLGPAVFITVPGELFPELANGGFGRDLPGGDAETNCPAADTGRPYEPVIRDQFAGVTYKFLFGLGQDELGYIVPKYDFWAFGFPPSDEEFPAPIPPPLPAPPDPDPRPPIYLGLVERVDPCGVSHYEETVSAASTMAPIVACTAAELAGHDPFGTYDTDSEYEACSPENLTTQPGGIVLPPL
jgi:hypothetical protein